MASSALASQLQALASTSLETSGRKPFTRPSILFDPREAADIDLHTVFSLALSGLDELVTLDSRFEAFKSTIFSQKSHQIDRDVQDKDFNTKLDSSISSFLRLLSAYLLLTPAHHTLEYLIRRYKVHVYNVDDVVKCILPYHGTSLFVRVVQILRIEKTKWHFLESVKISGAALPRIVLIQQCLRDFSVLQAISEWGILLSNESTKSRIVLSFSVTVMMECIGRVQKLDSDLVGRIMTFVLHGFEKGVAEEFCVGSLMIIGSLANRTMISEGVIETLFNAIAKFCKTQAESDKLLRMCLMVMIQLTQTQEMNHFPRKAFSFIVKVSGFVDVLTELSKAFNADKFLCLLLRILVGQSVANFYYEEILLRLLDVVPLKSHVESIISSILDVYLESTTATSSLAQDSDLRQHKSVEVMNKALLVLAKRYPTELDEGISKCLQANKDMDKTNKIIIMLREVLQGTLHAPMVESKNSLFLSLANSEASVRMLAVQQLSDITCDALEKKKLETLVLLREEILQRLYDDDLRVTRVALSTKGLVEIVDAERLLEALTSMLSRCKEVLQSGTKSLKAEARLLMRECFQVLVSGFLKKNPVYQPNVGCIILSHLLHSKIWKLNISVLKVAKELHWDLFDGLSQLEENTDSSNCTNQVQRDASEFSYCRKVIDCLANSLLEDHTRVSMLLLCAVKYGGKSLVLWVLIRYFTKASLEMMYSPIKEIFDFLKQEWLALESEERFLASALNQVHIALEDILCDETLGFLLLEDKLIFPRLLLVAFNELVKTMPTLNVDKQEHREAWDNIFQELFVFFTAASAKVLFENHIQLILKHVSAYALRFLSRIFTAEGSSFPVTTQTCSLDLLVSEPTVGLVGSSHTKSVQIVQLQIAIPSLLVPLASPVKRVRESASDCIKKVSDFWQEHASSLGKNGVQSLQVPLLPADTFAAVLEALRISLSAFASDDKFLAIFLASLLNPEVSTKETGTSFFAHMRLSESCQKSIFLFILHHALLLDNYAKLALITALKGAGHVVEQVLETRELLNTLLSKRRKVEASDAASSALSGIELRLLKCLLQTILDNACILASVTGEISGRSIVMHALIEGLNIDGYCMKDPAVVEICQVALDSLSPEVFSILDSKCQDEVLQRLLHLGRSQSEIVRLSSVSALRRIDLEVMIVIKHIDKLVSEELSAGIDVAKFSVIDATAGLLEFLVWKSDLKERQCLVPPLFLLLKKLFQKHHGALVENNLKHNVLPYLQQLSMTVLKNIVSSAMEKDGFAEEVDFDLLVEIIHDTINVTTRNEALSLLAVLAKLFPDQTLKFVENLFPILGETTVQDDSVSAQVAKELISAVVPSWLEKTNDPGKLLEVLVKSLPYIPLYRRIPMVKHTLSVMNEDASLHIFLLLTFSDALSGTSSNKRIRDKDGDIDVQLDWGRFIGEFREQICQQYPPSIKLPTFVKLLAHSGSDRSRENVETGRSNGQNYEMPWSLQKNVLDFISSQLKRMERQSELDFVDNDNEEAFISLMKEALLLTSHCTANVAKSSLRLNKSVEDSSHSLFFSCMNLMSLASFAKGMAELLAHSELNMKLQVLEVISLKISGSGLLSQESRGRKDIEQFNAEGAIFCNSIEHYASMIRGITELLGCTGDGSLKLKLAAISTLENFAVKISKILPAPFISSLNKLITSTQSSRKLATASFHCIASIVSNVGISMLSILPEFMPVLINVFLQYATWFTESASSKPVSRSEVLIAVLICLEATVNSLGSFLSPHVEKILNLVILQPAFNANNDETIRKRAAALRALLPAKLPVRLIVDPILHLYDMALEGGETSTATYFQALLLVVNALDRASVTLYYDRIFNLCLSALDLRHKPPKSFFSVTDVESSIISAFTGLALKLSESTFKPLFMRMLEWSESDTHNEELYSNSFNVYRSITFYRVVNELADKLRSIFVPYFRHLLDGCIYRLTEGDIRTRHKKKSRLSDERLHKKTKHTQLTSSQWHVRQLILSALHKCFSYDTIGFLDASKFQLLLVPIVSQITVEPPVGDDSLLLPINGTTTTKETIPSVDDMDKTLVLCIGQMALTAGTDLLWKTLNHEVLLCTRNESTRARKLGLEVVKFLVDHLKEEYLVLLPETIPFLAELLEDSDLTIVAKSQEIIKLLEDLSGESLSQYL